MALVPHIRWLLLGSSLLLLAACQTGNERPSDATGERYFTWVDESGQVRTSPIKREQTPIISRQQSKTVSSDNMEGGSDAGSSPDSGTDSDRITTSGASGRAGEDPASEYTLENYPDGDELEKSGYIRPGDPLPYFTWRDTDGNFRVSYYRPDTRSDVEKGLVRQPVKLTPAEVYGPPRDDVGAESPSRPATDAFGILGIESDGPSFFDQWQRSCCQNLLVTEPREWSPSREFELTIEADTASHPFSSCTSAYRLVRLPEPERAPSLIIRLRSFDMEGLFVPSAAFLDQNLETTRVVTGLAATFMPESWHRHGYLEAFVPAFPDRGERWLLLFTRDQDLDSQTVVETDRGPRIINHAPVGVISLTEMQP